MIGRDWSMVGSCSLVGSRGSRVDWFTNIGDISNITIVVVSIVSNILGTAIRKSNRVGTGDCSISIRGLSSTELGLGVVISNSVSIGVWLRLLLVHRGSSMISRSMDNRGPISRGMDNRGLVGRGMDNRGPISRGMDNWGLVGRGNNNRGFVGRGSMVDRGSMIGRCSMIGRGSMVDRSSMIGRCSMVCWGSMIGWGWSICSLHREGSRSNNTSRRLLKGTIAMYRLWGSMRLTDHRGMYSAMGLVDRVADRRCITMLDTLVVSLVCNSSGHKGEANENFHVVVRRVLIN